MCHPERQRGILPAYPVADHGCRKRDPSLTLGMTGVFVLFSVACAAPTAEPSSDSSTPTGTATHAPADWRRGATCYEVFVRSFSDSDGNGIGDLRGLTQKLDYLNDGNS